MKAKLPVTPHSEQLLLNAYSIDFVHGGAFAWAYLAFLGVSDREIQRILNAPPHTWCHRVQDVEATARSAMTAIGMYRR